MRILFHIIVAVACIFSLSYLFLDVLDRELGKAPVEKNIEIPEQH